MIANDIAHRNAHIFAVHILDVLLKSVLVANISGMYYKGRVLVLSAFAYFINQHARAVGAYLCICDLQKTVVCFVDVFLIEIKVISFLFLAHLDIIIFSPIAAWNRHRNKSSLKPTVERKLAVRVCLNHVFAVGYGNSAKRRAVRVINVSAVSVIIDAEIYAYAYATAKYDYYHRNQQNYQRVFLLRPNRTNPPL